MTRGYRDIFCLFTKWAGKLGITFTSLSMAMYLYTLKFNFHSLRWLLQCSKGWSLGDGCQGQFAILFLVASLPSFSQTIPGCFHNWPKCVQRTALVTKTLPCTQLCSYDLRGFNFFKASFSIETVTVLRSFGLRGQSPSMLLPGETWQQNKIISRKKLLLARPGEGALLTVHRHRNLENDFLFKKLQIFQDLKSRGLRDLQTRTPVTRMGPLSILDFDLCAFGTQAIVIMI